MMENRHLPQDSPATYQIQVKGLVDQRWSDWFENFTITHRDETHTLLVGPISDQSALHGLLTRIRDLGLILIAVERQED